MTETQTKALDAAKELSYAFVTVPVVKLRDNTAQWIRDAVREAHGEMFPDDWVYDMCRKVASSIVEALEYGDFESVRDRQPELVDGLVDVYTSDLTAWLHSHVYRVGYCDEASDGYEPDNGIVGRIMQGQYFEIGQIFSALLSAIEAQVGDLS